MDIKSIINSVYQDLKNRKLHPMGTFDKGGRFYIEESELVNVRAPSAAWPFSEMKAGRTKKFVKAIVEKYSITTEEELRAHFKTA